MSLNKPLGIGALALSAVSAVVSLWIVSPKKENTKRVASWLALLLILIAIFLLAVDVNKSHPLLKLKGMNLLYFGVLILGLLILLYSIFSKTKNPLYARGFAYILFFAASVMLLMMEYE